MLTRITAPLQIPFIIWKIAFSPQENNCIARKKNTDGLTGQINVSTCPPIDINELKMVSKVEGVTINDVILAALSNTFNTIFKEKGD